jgi:hypothetical protein
LDAGALFVLSPVGWLVVGQAEKPLRGEDLELTKVVVAAPRRRIAAGTEQVRRLVVEAKRLHRRDHRAASAPRDQQRLLSDLPRQRASEWVLKQLQDSLGLASQQRRTQTIQKRQHRDPVVFGVIYTL